MSKVEYVEMVVRVPKLVVDFLKTQNIDVKRYIEKNIVGVVRADIDAEAFYNPERVKTEYGLDEVFKALGVS